MKSTFLGFMAVRWAPCNGDVNLVLVARIVVQVNSNSDVLLTFLCITWAVEIMMPMVTQSCMETKITRLVLLTYWIF